MHQYSGMYACFFNLFALTTHSKISILRDKKTVKIDQAVLLQAWSIVFIFAVALTG